MSTVNEEEIKYSEEEAVTGANGGTAAASAGGTSGLLTSEEYKANAINVADKNFVARQNLAKKVLDNTYASLDRAYEETKTTAEAAKRRGLVDADSAHKLTELKYGAEEEALSGSGLSGSGLSEYQRSKAYQQNREDRQATYAEYDRIMREAAYNRDTLRLDADLKYADAEASAQIEHNNALAEIGEKAFSYGELERQAVDESYRGFVDGIRTGATTLAAVKADSYWTKLSDEQKAALESAQKVKTLKDRLDGGAGWGDVEVSAEYKGLSSYERNELKAYYHQNHITTLGSGDTASRYEDYYAMAEAGMDISAIEALAATNGDLGALKDGKTSNGESYWDTIAAVANNLPTGTDTVGDAYYQEWLAKIQTGEMALSDIKALAAYSKIVEPGSAKEKELRDAYVQRGLLDIQTLEAMNETELYTKTMLEVALKSNGYTGEDLEAVIAGWQERNYESVKNSKDLTLSEVSELASYGMISSDQAKELRAEVERIKALGGVINFTALDDFGAGRIKSEAYLLQLPEYASAYNTKGGWTVTGLGRGGKGDTFEVKVGGDEDFESVKLVSLGKVGPDALKSIKTFLEENNITIDGEAVTAGEGRDINIFADHDATSEDAGKEHKLIVVNKNMYMKTKEGWIEVGDDEGGGLVNQLVAQYLWGSYKLKEESLADTGLTREDYENTELSVGNLLATLNPEGGSSLSFSDYIAAADKIRLMDGKYLLDGKQKGKLISGLISGLDKVITKDVSGNTMVGGLAGLSGYVSAVESLGALESFVKGADGYSEEKYAALQTALYNTEATAVQNEISAINGLGGDLALYYNKKRELMGLLDKVDPAHHTKIKDALHTKAGELAVAEANALVGKTNLKDFRAALERLKGLAKDDAEALGINSKDKNGEEIADSSANAVISAYISVAKDELEGLGNGYEDLTRAGEITDYLEALLNAGFVDGDAKDAIYAALQLDANMVEGFDLKTSRYKKGARLTDGAALKALDKAVLGKTGAVSAEYNGKMYYREPIESWIAPSTGYNWYALEEDYSKPDNLSGKLGDDTEYEIGKFEDKWGDYVAIGDTKYSVKDSLTDGTKSALNKKFADVESGKYVKLDGRYYVKLEKGFEIGSLSVKRSDWYYAAEAGKSGDSFAETVVGGVGDAVGGFFGAVGDSLADSFGPDTDIPEGSTLKNASYTETKKTTHAGATHTERFVNGMKIYSTKGTTKNNRDMLEKKYPSAKVNTVVEYNGVYYIKEKTLFGSKWKRVVLGN